MGMSGAGGAPGAHPRCAGGDPRPGAWRPHLPWRAEPGRAGGGRSGRRRREEGEGGGGGDEGGGGRQRSGRPGSAAPHGPPGHSSRTAPRPARRPRPRGEAGVSPRRVISSANCRPGEGQDGGGGRAPPQPGAGHCPVSSPRSHRENRLRAGTALLQPGPATPGLLPVPTPRSRQP